MSAFLITALISAFWSILGSIMTLIGVSQLISNLNTFIGSLTSYLPTFATYISYVYFFIDRDRLIPLISLTLFIAMVRLAFSIFKLIKW